MKAVKVVDEKAEEVFLVMTLVAMVVLIFMQVIGRYLFGSAPSWTEELARYIHVWQVWIGASFAVKRGEHIRIEAFRNIFNALGRKVMDTVSIAIWFALAIFLAIYGTDLVLMSYENGQTSPAMQMPMWLPFAAIPLGGFGMSIRLLQQLVLIWKTSKTIDPAISKGA